ncbi:MAG TPA: hypothetical protein VFF67_01145 [Thermoplasmata archaeon]|nr:hypothetical protein [Thermoplasmata archaeon]
MTAAPTLPGRAVPVVATFTVNDSESCQSTGATWANYTCNFNAYTFLPGGQWVFSVSVAFRGPVKVWGNVAFKASADEDQPIVSLKNVMTIEKGGQVSCICLFLIFSASAVVNSGTFALGTQVSYVSTGAGYMRISNRSTFINELRGTLTIGNCGPNCYVFAGVSVEDGGGLVNYGHIVNSGQLTVTCGAVWANHGRFDLVDGGSENVQTGLGCVTLSPVGGPAGRPVATANSNGSATNSGSVSVSFGSTISIPYNATFTNTGALTLGPGGSVCVGFNGTLSNSGSIVLDQGYPSLLIPAGTINDLDCGSYHPGHPVANTGTIFDAGNISGDISGSGSVQVACGGSAYRNQGTITASNSCHPTKVTIAPATRLALPGGYAGLDAVVVDTSATPTPPVGTVTWNSPAAGGRFVQNAFCTLVPVSTNSSGCPTIYRAPMSNGIVAINASYNDGALTAGFAPAVGTANLTVGAARAQFLTGSKSCQSLGGTWSSNSSSCSVAGLTVGSNTSLTIGHGITLGVTLSLNVSGVFGVWGNLTVRGTAENRGTVASNGTIWIASGARWTNDGVLQLSQSPLLVDGTLVNEAVLYDATSLCSGCPTVLGNITNRGSFATQAGAELVDTVSSFASSGYVINVGSGSVVENGSWAVSPIVSSSGRFVEGAVGVMDLNGGFDNYGNLTVRGELMSGVGAPLRNERSAVVFNDGLLAAVPLQNLAAATFWNRANATLNLTGISSNAGTLRNLGSASIALAANAQLMNQIGGVVRNSAGGSIVNRGSLFDAGGLTNVAGAQLFNAYLLNISGGGTISNGGVIANSAPPADYDGVLPPAGTLIASGNLTGSGTIDDTLGNVDTGCGGVVTALVVGHPAQSVCGHPTGAVLTPQMGIGIINQSLTLSVAVYDTSRKAASPPSGNVTFTLGSGADGPSFATCTLARSGNNSSTCHVAYAPPTSLAGNVTAEYLGDLSHQSSPAFSSLVVWGRSTSATLTASKSSTRAGGNLTARLNVTDVNPGPSSAPTGLVFWADSGLGGSFASLTCALKPVNSTSSSCSVVYTAPFLNGNDSVIGTYIGDAIHRGDSAANMIAVGSPCSCHTWGSAAPQDSGNFGAAVAVSGGRTVVGAPGENSSKGSLTGIAYVLNTTTGALISTLVSPNASYSGSFGSAVAISGNLVVVGAPLEGSAFGHAYLYNASSGRLLDSWGSPSGQSVSYFGSAVAIDGRTVVVGAPYESVPLNGTNVSAAGRVYEFSATTGKLVRAFLDPKPFYSDEFGYALALNGSRLLIGQPQFNSAYSPYGPGHAFLYNSSSGRLVARLSSSHPRSGGYFGSSVALDPVLAVVGAYNENVATAVGAGRAYVFDAANGTALAALRSPRAAFLGKFGYAVAAAGSEVIAGAPGESVYGHAAAGSVYEFSSNGTLLSTLVGPGVQSDFGYSVAASGARVVVGAPYETVDAHVAAGRVLVF